MNKMSKSGAGLLAGLLLAPTVCAQSSTQLERVVVTGVVQAVEKSDLSSDPAAAPASVTVLRWPDEKKRNTRDYTELLKPLVGVAANNFDQGGVGFGFTMRGFSERSNGGFVAYSIDGVPINLPSHALTNGYGDLTPLIPELLDTTVLTRGPWDVRFGTNSLGGSIAFTTQALPERGVAVSVGSFDFGRVFAALPFGDATGGTSGYASLVGSTTSGYRDNADLDVINSFNKLSFAMPGGRATVRLQLFGNRFGSPGYLRRELVENGTLNPRTAINSTDGGKVEQHTLSFQYRQDGDRPMTATVYAVRSMTDRYSTRLSTVPVDETRPGQALQVDDRWTYGVAVDKYMRWDDRTGFDLLLGAGARADDVESRVFNTVQRVRGARTEDTDFRLVNPFVYAQANAKPVPWGKLTIGVRYDRLDFDIEDRTRTANVSPNFGVAQPKAGVAVKTPIDGLEIFANYGRGFLAPSAIGGQLSRDPSLRAPELTTREIGVQWKSRDGAWQVVADVYRTKFTNEIQNRPPPALPIYLGPSTRDGWDVDVRHIRRGGSMQWAAFANYSELDGELVNRATGTSIPDVAEWFAKYGFDLAIHARGDDRLTVSFAHVWQGPKPLEPTNTLRTKTFSRIDLKGTYELRSGVSFYAGANIYPDRRLDETAFTFGTPATVGVSPKAPLTVQVGAFVPF